MKDIILKSIIGWFTFFITIIFLWIWYAAINNIWTPPSSLEVTPSSKLTADSWNKLLGNFENLNSKLNATPIVWSWGQTSERTGLGKFIWDQELMNTSNGIFWWSAGQNYITINESGYYEIYGDVLGSGLSDNQRQDARLVIDRWGSLIYLSTSLWMGWASQVYYKHHLKHIWDLQSGDKVYIDINHAWSRYWLSIWNWTKLTIRKL